MITELEYALNYQKIVSFAFDEKDYITRRIINYYQEYVFGTNQEKKNRIKNLDKVIYEYLTNLKFNKYVLNYLDKLEKSNRGINYYNNLDTNLPKLYKQFEKENLDTISIAKWL